MSLRTHSFVGRLVDADKIGVGIWRGGDNGLGGADQTPAKHEGIRVIRRPLCIGL